MLHTNQIETPVDEGLKQRVQALEHELCRYRESNRDIESSRQFLLSALDAQNDHIALLNAQGDILRVNKAWRHFATSNAAKPETVSEGENYLLVCDQARGYFSEEAAPFAQGIRAVLTGEKTVFTLEYPCHSQDQVRWFCGRVTPFEHEGARHALVVHEDITDLKQSQADLKENEAKFRAIFEGAEDGILLADATSRQLSMANTRICEMLGYSRNEILELTIEELHPEDERPDILKAYAQQLTGEQKTTENAQVRRKDGTILFADITGSPLHIDNQDMLAGIFRDVSDRKRNQEAIVYKNEVERTFSDLSTCLLNTSDIEDISVQVLEAAKKLTGCRFGFVGSIEPATGHLISHSMSRDIWNHCEVPDKSIVFEKNAGLWGWALEHQQSILVNDAPNDPRSTGTPPGHIPVERFLGVPALIKGRLVGLIALCNPEYRFLATDLMLVKRLAAIYALALQRQQYVTALVEAEAQKAEQLEKLVQERTAELSASKELLEKVFTSQLDAIFVLNNDTPPLILDCNPAAERLFGYRREEMIGSSTAMLHCDTEHLKTFRTLLTAGLEKSGVFHLKEFQMKHRSGEVFFTENSGAQLLDKHKACAGWISVVHDISEHKRHEQLIRQSEQNFRTVAEFTFDWEDWRAPEGHYLYISPSCERITGYPREDFLRDSSLTLDIIHPEDRSRLARHIESEQADRKIHQIDFRIITPEGEVRWLSHFCQPVFDKDGTWLGRRGSSRDITQRKLAEDQLKTNQDLLQGVFDGISDPLYLINASMQIKTVNKAVTQFFKISAGSLTGKKCHEVFFNRTAICDGCRVRKAIQDNKRMTYERAGCQDPGKVEQVNIYPLLLEKEEPGAIIHFRDITKAKHLEQELLQADKMISLGVLVSGVAHEINNPNNFIMLNAPLLQEAWQSIVNVLDQVHGEQGDFEVGGLSYTEIRESFPRLLSGIEEGSQRIKEIVRGLKDFSRRNEADLNHDVSVGQVVEEAVLLLNNLIKKSTGHFGLDLDPVLPLIKGNHQKLEQVVINLIQNACQALPATNRALFVRAFLDSQRGGIVIQVSDEGIGIPHDSLSRIMDPFFTTKRTSGGTGLGLSVSMNIVKEHGGSIEVSSEEGNGTTMTVFLPKHRS